jgi:hypothetical protein
MGSLLDHTDAIINIIAMLATAVSIYLGIRVELVRLHEKDNYQDKEITRVDVKADYVDKRLSHHIENHDRRIGDRSGQYPVVDQ